MRGFNDAAAAFDGLAEHGLFGSRVAAEILGARAEEARERFLDDDVPAAPQRLHGQRLVRRRRAAKVDHVHRVAERLERIEGRN